MQYKGDDMNLRVPNSRQSPREPYPTTDYDPAGPRWARQPSYAASDEPLWVDETVLACCNYAYDVATANGAGEVDLEHLVNAMTRVEAAARILEARGVREGQLRRESAALIASELPANGGTERTQPRRSADLEDALRRASDQAARRGTPAGIDDLLWVLFHFGREVPAIALLRRVTPDWQRLDWQRGREIPQPAPMPVAPAPLAQPQIVVAPPTISYDALAGRMSLIEDSLRTLHAELGSERKAITDLLRDTQRDIVAQRGDAAALRSDLAQRLETVERGLQVRPEASRLTVQLSDRLQSLEKAVHGGLGEGARNWAALGQRLQTLEETFSEAREAVVSASNGSGAARDVLERLASFEQALDGRLGQSQRLVGGLGERLGAIERIVEAGAGEGGRHWTQLSERLGAIETTLRTRSGPAAELTQLLGRLDELGSQLSSRAAATLPVDWAELVERIGGLERAVRAGFGESARTIGIITDRMETVERNTQAHPAADDGDAILILDDRMQSIERLLQDRLATAGSVADAALGQPIGQQLSIIEQKASEHSTAIQGLVSEAMARLTALEQRLQTSAATIEQHLAASSAVAAMAGTRDREIAEMHEAIVRLSENQTTLASAIADWRHDCQSDFNAVNIQLEKLAPAFAAPATTAVHAAPDAVTGLAPVPAAAAQRVETARVERADRYVDALGRTAFPASEAPGRDPAMRDASLRQPDARDSAAPVVPSQRRGFWWWLFGTDSVTRANREAAINWQRMQQRIKETRDRQRERA